MTTTQSDRSAGDLITTADVASILGCSPRSVTNYVRDGRLPAPIRVNRLVRFSRRAISGFLGLAL